MKVKGTTKELYTKEVEDGETRTKSKRREAGRRENWQDRRYREIKKEPIQIGFKTHEYL